MSIDNIRSSWIPLGVLDMNCKPFLNLPRSELPEVFAPEFQLRVCDSSLSMHLTLVIEFTSLESFKQILILLFGHGNLKIKQS